MTDSLRLLAHHGTDDGAGTSHPGSRDDCQRPGCVTQRAEAERITAAISVALREHDMPGAAALVKLLAVTDAEKAQAVYDTLLLGLQMASHMGQ